MKVLLSELDGTTWMGDYPKSMCSPELRAPIYPRMDYVACMDGTIPVEEIIMRVRRYKLIGFSGGIAFYDRIIDVEEIR